MSISFDASTGEISYEEFPEPPVPGPEPEPTLTLEEQRLADMGDALHEIVVALAASEGIEA